MFSQEPLTGEVTMNPGWVSSHVQTSAVLSRRVVEHDMQLSLPIAPRQQVQELQKVGSGVPCATPPDRA